MVDAAVDFLGLHGVDPVGVAGFEEPEDIARPWRQLGLDETVGTPSDREALGDRRAVPFERDSAADVAEYVAETRHV